jgi:hypothetical protein
VCVRVRVGMCCVCACACGHVCVYVWPALHLWASGCLSPFSMCWCGRFMCAGGGGVLGVVGVSSPWMATCWRLSTATGNLHCTGKCSLVCVCGGGGVGVGSGGRSGLGAPCRPYHDVGIGCVPALLFQHLHGGIQCREASGSACIRSLGQQVCEPLAAPCSLPSVPPAAPCSPRCS